MASLETINGRLRLVLDSLDKAAKEIGDLPMALAGEYVASIKEAANSISQIQREVNSLLPGLETGIAEEAMPDSFSGSPPEQMEEVNLTASEVEEIDELLLSYAKHSWRKGAMLVALAMVSQDTLHSSVPELYYSERIKRLVQNGRLESKGDLHYLRDSEVRLPDRRAA